MILSLDTTETKNIFVELRSLDGKTIAKLSENQQQGSQVLLPMIMKILKKNKFTLKNISKIEVNPGPGSFTGTRVGVSVANALSFALQVPVNGKKGKIVLPIYDKSKFD
jgi:tRNA threonylcarbamoyladenosine biosynthesis protein TsaB